MTPVAGRNFDHDVVQNRLRTIRELLNDLESLRAVTEERLTEDRLTRHAVERILSQLVDLAVSVNGYVAATVVGRAPEDYRGSFQLAAESGLIEHDLAKRLLPSVGMRNVLAHEYVNIDLTMVADATPKAIADYGDYVTQAARWLRERYR